MLFIGTVAYYDTRKIPVSTIHHINGVFKGLIYIQWQVVKTIGCLLSQIIIISSHVNYRYLTASEKDTILSLLKYQNSLLKSKMTDRQQ